MFYVEIPRKRILKVRVLAKSDNGKCYGWHYDETVIVAYHNMFAHPPYFSTDCGAVEITIFDFCCLFSYALIRLYLHGMDSSITIKVSKLDKSNNVNLHEMDNIFAAKMHGSEYLWIV